MGKGLDKRLSKVGKNLGSMWDKMSAVAGQAAAAAAQAAVNMVSDASPSVLSDYAEEHLARIGDNLENPFDAASDPVHARILEDLWGALQAVGLQDEVAGTSVPFARCSSAWRLAGFQTDDPSADLKTTGVVALQVETASMSNGVMLDCTQLIFHQNRQTQQCMVTSGFCVVHAP